MNNIKLFEKLWKSCNQLRGKFDWLDYKYVILTIIFFKFTSDVYEIRNKKRTAIEDEQDIQSEGIVIVPEEYSWNDIIKKINDEDIGHKLDSALSKMQNINPKLRGGLWIKFGEKFENSLDKLRQIMLIFDKENFGITIEENRVLLGSAYEYFLERFSELSGRLAEEFYTPKSIVELMVNILQPEKINTRYLKAYDPISASGGIFVYLAKMVKENNNIKNYLFIGQAIRTYIYILAIMNLAIQGLNFDLGNSPAYALIDDLHKNKTNKMDIVISNPPSNLPFNKDHFKSDDSRWKYGFPNENKANYFFLQHMIDKLNSTGRMAVLLDNGSTTSNATKNIREAILKDDLYEAIIQLPSSIFFGTSIPATLFILNKAKKNKNKILFLDATDICTKEGKVNILKKAHINKIIEIYDNYQLNISSSKSLFSKIVDTKTVIDNNSSLSIKQYLTSNEVQLDPKEEYIRSINNIESVVIGLGEEFKNILELLKESKKQ